MAVLLEICIDSIESAIAAKLGGADRLEVCGSLETGGITPSYGLVKQCISQTQLPVMMMIRPRGGNFVYSESELQCMIDNVNAGRLLGVQGFVFGCLTKDSNIHLDQCRKLMDAIGDAESTFHRAFDEMTTSPEQDLEAIIQLGANRLLTSGREKSAVAGKELISRLVHQSKDRISIMAGAGINSANVSDIVSSTGVNEVHGSASVAQENVESSRQSTGQIRMTSSHEVTAIRRELDKN